MPRFVVLQHSPHPDPPPNLGEGMGGGVRGLHWDFMLQWGGVLRTWALAQPPAPGIRIEAERLFDHRLKYLDYEGPISGDRGAVTRWDSGQYELLEQRDDLICVRLDGNRLKGKAVLNAKVPDAWQFYLEPDSQTVGRKQ